MTLAGILKTSFIPSSFGVKILGSKKFSPFPKQGEFGKQFKEPLYVRLKLLGREDVELTLIDVLPTLHAQPKLLGYSIEPRTSHCLINI